MFYDAGALMCCICYCVIKRSIVYVVYTTFILRFSDEAAKRCERAMAGCKDINDISTHNIIEFSC